jgi:AmmeMemoRadiSam system protein B/AmmeMemoRadiSam system protein A
MILRQTAVAGRFYPGEPEALGRMVDECLARPRARHPAPKALIAPHAGFVYLGPIAGTAYATLATAREAITRVVLIGPSHRVAFRGIAVSGASAFDGPLGLVMVDRRAIQRITHLPGVQIRDDAHRDEHSLEVQIPFLQRVLGTFRIVPIVVGDAGVAVVDAVIEALWGGPETLIVVSSDLSHYHGYEEAGALDKAASQAIEMLRPDLLKDDSACGNRPIRGLLARARRLDLRATTLDLRNSGDTHGPKDRVVGYGAYAFEYSAAARLEPAHRAALLDAAVRSVRHGVAAGKPPKVELGTFAPQLEAVRATFVTLEIGGRPRGCIGTTIPHRPLIEDVVENAYKSAFADPRFPKLTADELDRLSFSISILSTPRPIVFASEAALLAELRPDRDGLILTAGEKRGLFLPQVWATLPEPRTFLSRLKTKAGLAEGYWSNEVRAHRFSTETFETAAPGRGAT